MNTEQVWGGTEQEEIYGITNKHRRTAEGEDYGMVTSLRRYPYIRLLLTRRLILSLLERNWMRVARKKERKTMISQNTFQKNLWKK